MPPTRTWVDAIRSRRVVRAMTAEPVDREALETVLDAVRWAPTAGNRHLQRFVATDDRGVLRVLRAVSPGMLQRPAAAITVCFDRGRRLRLSARGERPVGRRGDGGGHRPARRPRDRGGLTWRDLTTWIP